MSAYIVCSSCCLRDFDKIALKSLDPGVCYFGLQMVVLARVHVLAYTWLAIVHPRQTEVLVYDKCFLVENRNGQNKAYVWVGVRRSTALFIFIWRPNSRVVDKHVR